MYLACPFIFFVSNKRQNGWTDQAQFFLWQIHDSREGLWLVEIEIFAWKDVGPIQPFWRLLDTKKNQNKQSISYRYGILFLSRCFLPKTLAEQPFSDNQKTME